MPSPSTIGVIACCVITGLTSAIAALAVREMVYGDTVPAEAYVLLASLPAAVVPSVAAVGIVLWERRQNMREPAQRLLTVLNRLDVNFTDIHDRAKRHVEVRTGRKPREAGDPYHAYVAFGQITANFKDWAAELKPDLLANDGGRTWPRDGKVRPGSTTRQCREDAAGKRGRRQEEGSAADQVMPDRCEGC